MTFLKLQDYFFRHLSESDDTFCGKNNIPDYELKRIIAIVKYIDERMNLNNECISIIGTINSMRRIIKDINDCSTGVSEIDEVAYERMKSYIKEYGDIPKGKEFIFYRDPSYVESLIGILSQYGGLYKFVISHENNSLIDDNWKSVFQDEYYARIHRLWLYYI